MKLIYPAVFTPCEKKDGYTVTVPDLPGCVSEGDSLVGAIEMGTDAACGWVLGELEDGNTIPSPTPREQVASPDGGFVNLLVLDMDSYAEKYGDKAVRKNITIPAWLNTFGEAHNVNFSRVLQDALLDMAQS
jgi:predicted RNase H-like HicB family nuclease